MGLGTPARAAANRRIFPLTPKTIRQRVLCLSLFASFLALLFFSSEDMSSPDYVSYAYALIVFGGGLMGYAKAGIIKLAKVLKESALFGVFMYVS